MANITFGKTGMSMPTPSWVAFWIDIFSAVAGVLITWLLTASYIPSNVSNIIGSILGLLLSIAQVIKPFFGVANAPSKVPVEEVTAMDEKATK